MTRYNADLMQNATAIAEKKVRQARAHQSVEAWAMFRLFAVWIWDCLNAALGVWMRISLRKIKSSSPRAGSASR